MTPGPRAATSWKIALFVFAVAGILWLGTANVRMVIGGELLKPWTLEFEDYISPDAEREVFRLLSVTGVISMAAYAVTFLSSIIVLAGAPLRLKEHGWIVLAAVLFYLFVPAEIFVMAYDARMAYHEFFTTSDNTIFREIFLARAGALAGVPIIAMLCYFTIIALAVFQPLKRPVREAP